MFVTRVISDDGLRREGTGFVLDIRLPWYRSLPLSTVEIADLKVNGRTVDKARIRFSLNGKSFEPEDLVNHPEEWWFVLDSAFLHVEDFSLAAGAQEEVELTVGLYPPYIPGFHRLTECTKRFAAQ